MECCPGVKVAFEHAWGHQVGASPDYSVLAPLFAFADNPNVYIKTAINNIAAAREAGGTPEQLYTKHVLIGGGNPCGASSRQPLRRGLRGGFFALRGRCDAREHRGGEAAPVRLAEPGEAVVGEAAQGSMRR